ncbi:hypothetical protein [Levilactobacillus humaensis]|uniref:hypothetical protein n=1 Tax=Levilactobacillus humaensis TaxID=2950375 RepID=UPI0021C4B19D|nr:hypothetical protein [Levilactobacillus humaensis]
MKTSEFKQRIEDAGYSVTEESDYYSFSANRGVAMVSKVDARRFSVYGLPLSVTNVVVEYAYTPIEKRENEKIWNVVLGYDYDCYVAWRKDDGAYTTTATATAVELLNDDDFVFTDSEFNVLIDHLKSLTNGATYAKIAELGKREVTLNAD